MSIAQQDRPIELIPIGKKVSVSHCASGCPYQHHRTGYPGAVCSGVICSAEEHNREGLSLYGTTALVFVPRCGIHKVKVKDVKVMPAEPEIPKRVRRH